MNKIYVSLTEPLLGLCIAVTGARGHDHVRFALSLSKLHNNLWCSTYDTSDMMEIVKTVKVSDLVMSSKWDEYERECSRVGIEP